MTQADIDPIAWLVAHEQIRQLAARYAVLLDARDLDGLVELFVDDVIVGTQCGHDALKANFASQLAGLGVTVLHVGGHVIDITSATTASGIVSCAADIARSSGRITQAIQYHDTYTCRDGVWKFVRRKHLLIYDGPDRGPLPESLPSWQHFVAATSEQSTNEGVPDD